MNWLMLAGMLLTAAVSNHARAATIQTGEVIEALGPTFFVNDAIMGGGDITITQPSVASYNRSFAGLLTPNTGLARVTLTGFGFATANAPADNTATTIAVTFTYLGADEAEGGGDDVLIGSASGEYAYASNGEYVFAFDVPMTAELNITGTRFLIEVAPANATNNGKVRFKTDALTYETADGPKFSVAGFVAPLGVNLAKFQPVTVDSTNGQFLASYVTDGKTGTFNRWQSVNGGAPHWARVDFPFTVDIGSAQVFTGADDTNPQQNFRIQYLSGESWLDAPDGVITANTNVERNIVFTEPVTASSFRIFSNDTTLRVRELALYPPNDDMAFPLGSDLTLNLAQQRPAVANARTAGNYALLATDGRVNKDSKWQTSTAGANYLEIDLSLSTDPALNVKIGSAHLYSGSPGVDPLANFVLKYWNGSAWLNIPGGSVTGNTTADRVVSFNQPVSTGKVRLEFTNTGTTSVRELCIFPANTGNPGNPGYPIGTSITGLPPITAKADDYTDSFYQISNPAAGRFIAVGNNGQPALDASGLTTAQGQYQILLNHSNGTYRLRNRATGNCLSGAQLSKTAGQLLTDAPYSALPHQDWILDPLDGGAFQFINQWSGLAVDIQGGGTDAGTPLVQNTPNGSASQRWTMVYNTYFPKKGIGGTGTTGSKFGTTFNANWMYGWGLTTTAILPPDSVYHPMQWGNFNWTHNSTDPSTWKLYPAWRTNSQPLHLMGFNEPDRFDQSGNSLDTENTDNTNGTDFSAARALEKSVELWPRLMAMDLPLVAPCPANMTSGWLSSFYTQANALGYRMDYTAKHTYESPNGGSADSLIDGLLEGYTTWGKPMWLTEFSFVDWNENSSWTEEDCYNCLAEFLWRAESLPWLRKYALFVFTEDEDYPMPQYPWSTSVSTGGAPRSNARDINGNLTAFGKLYAAWDCDATVRADKTYYIHNKGTRKRLANNTTNVGARNIRIDSSLARWTLVAAPTNGRYYMVSSLDGRRLSSDGSSVSLAAAGATGTAAEWKLTEKEHGWYYLNPATSTNRLRMTYNYNPDYATYSMVAGNPTTDDVQWRFIVPPQPPVWSGTVSSSWTDAANWIPGVVPSSGDAIAFNSSSTANLATMLDQNFSPSGISVANPAGPVSISGTHNLTLGSGGFDLVNASQNLSVTAPLILSAAQNWSVGAGRVLNLNGGVSGAFQATVTGAGTVSLGAAVDPLTSITVAAGGTLKKSASGVLASGATAVTPTVSGTLDLNGTTQSVNTIAGTGVIDNTAAGTAQLTVGNNDVAVTLNTLLQDTGGNLALVKTGAGSLNLPAANTFAGGLTNNGTGNVVPQNASAFGTGPVVMNAGTVYPILTFTFSNALTLNGGMLRIGGGAGKSITWSGPVNVTADSEIRSDGNTSGITLSNKATMSGFTLSSFAGGGSLGNTISGPISGSGNIIVTSGTLNLNSANSFSGTLRSVSGGPLRIGDTLAMQNATLDMNAADTGTVNLNNLNAVIGALTGTRNLALGSGTVSIGNNHASTAYSGVLSGTGSLAKTGNGTLTLSGSNNYSGTTAIHSGTLALGANNVLPGTALSIGNATLDAATFTDTVGALAITGNATIHLGSGASLTFAASNGVPWSGALNITGAFVSGQSLKFGVNSGALLPEQLALITVNGGGTFTLNSTGHLIAAPVNPYDLWKTQITNGLDERGEDADGDGLTNLEEFLFGTPPMSGNASPVTTTSGGGNLTLRWLQRESGATYIFKQSATLATGSWSTVFSPVPALDGDQNGAPAGYKFHSVTLPTTGGRMFHRIDASEN